MRIVKIMCYFCNDEGLERKAIVSYFPPSANEEFDLCAEHKKQVEEQGFETYPITEAENEAY